VIYDAYEELSKSIANVSTNINGVLGNTLSKLRDFVDIYNKGKDDERVYTFGSFVAGLITLDSSVVEGYENTTGKIKISNEWKNKIATIDTNGVDVDVGDAITVGLQNLGDSAVGKFVGNIANNIKNFITGSSSSTPTSLATTSNSVDLSKGVWDFKISSWLDIFELKLWGWYYDLARKFDYAMSIILNVMLGLMATYFGITYIGKSALNKYLEKQSIPGQSKAWTQISAILLSAGFFYISPTTPSSGDDVNLNSPDFRFNNTLAKGFIRDVAYYGSKFATTTNDMGLVSYLTFVLKKENLMSNYSMQTSYVDNVVVPLINWHFEMPLITECMNFWNIKRPEDFVQNGYKKGINEANYDYAYNADFFVTNNLNEIDEKFCSNIITNYFRYPYESYKSAYEIRAVADNYDKDMAKAVNMIVDNQLLLEYKFGWVNVFSVPLSYYIMKNNDMFLTPSIDYDEISKNAESYLKGLNLRELKGVSDNKNDLTTFSSISTSMIGSVSNSIDKISARILSSLSYAGAYMMLPGFKDIFTTLTKTIYRYLELDLSTIRKTDNEGYLKTTKVLKSLYSKVKNIIYKVPMLKAFYFIKGAIDAITDPSPKTIYIAGTILSFIFAVFIWKYLFNVVFLTTVSFMILLKIVFYFKDLLFYFVVSPFIVLWAFATQQQTQMTMLNYVKKGLVLLVYPTLIVFVSYIFIFVYELINVLYLYLLNIFIESQKINVEIMNVASWHTDGFSAFMQLETMSIVMEVAIKIIGLILAYMTLFKGTEWILEVMGLNDTKLISSISSEQAMQKGEKYVNPIT